MRRLCRRLEARASEADVRCHHSSEPDLRGRNVHFLNRDLKAAALNSSTAISAPSGMSTIGCASFVQVHVDSFYLQYVGNRPSTDVVVEVGQRTLDPGVAPAWILLRHPHD